VRERRGRERSGREEKEREIKRQLENVMFCVFNGPQYYIYGGN
jgi:hypothetical protein